VRAGRPPRNVCLTEAGQRAGELTSGPKPLRWGNRKLRKLLSSILDYEGSEMEEAEFVEWRKRIWTTIFESLVIQNASCRPERASLGRASSGRRGRNISR
jgi:hypothetical protein